MANPFRNIRCINDPEYLEGQNTSKTLSIEFLPDGFVFSVMDQNRYQYVALEAYEAPNLHGVENYSPHIKDFFTNHLLLNQGFDKVIAAVYARDLVLIPAPVYSAEKQKDLFNTYALPESSSRLKNEAIQIIDAQGIYPVPENLLNVCEEIFPSVRVRNQGASMIKNVMAAQKLEKWKADVVIHVKKSHAEILLLHKEKLIFYRSFSITCFDDILYYVFYVLEQYQKQAEKLHLTVLGELPMDSKGYTGLNSFFRKVSIPDANDMFKYSQHFDSIPIHYYFNLLNLNTCE